MRRAVGFALLQAFVGLAAAQDRQDGKWNRPPNLFRQQHLLVRFDALPTAADLEQLRVHGAVILGPRSNHALSISAPPGFTAPDNVQWVGPFSPETKISTRIHAASTARDQSQPAPYFIVEFYPDVDMSDARSLATVSGLTIIENPDLVANHLLVQASFDSIIAFVASDEVEYVFPASDDLVHGIPVNSCSGALTSQGAVSQGVPTVGDGWDGPGRNAADLNYAFASLTDKIPADTTKSEIVRAFSEWAKYANLTFTETSDTTAPRTLSVLFARGAHGDAYPFQGTGTIAHTFYPSPLNPEPIAGDLHFNADENWHDGADTDVFSVALHETGHALGLGHSDNPGDVMYPYYKRVSTLAPGDITSILELYAAQDDTGPSTPPIVPPSLPASTPPAVVVDNTPTTVSSASVILTGSVTGGNGDVQVSWTNGSLRGTAEGTRSWTASISLQTGVNTITISAVDSQQNMITATVTVTRQAAAPPPPPPAVATHVAIVQPTSATSYSTSSASITVSGTASDSAGIDHVSWTSSRAGSGLATGTASWNAASIPLLSGQNAITVTAYGKSTGTASKTLTVTYNPPPPPATPTPSTPAPSGADTTPPTLTIMSPSSTNVYTTASTIVFSGTASDNVAVKSVTWTNSNGGSGTATGTTRWSTAPIPLLVGSNLITIRAADNAGNIGWRSVMVTRGQ